MRICFISREYPPQTHIGGIATYTHKTAAALARLGHEVHVVTAAWEPGAEYQENGVWVHRFEEPRVKPRELQQLVHARHVARTLARIPGQFDVVQACEWGGEALWFALRRSRHTPLVTRLATPLLLVERLNEHSRTGTRGIVQRLMERTQTTRSDGVISPTQALAREVASAWQIPHERITIVPTGMTSLPTTTTDLHELPEALQGAEYLVYFGRLEERKGVHILGEALTSVLTEFPHLKMVFVGDDLPYKLTTMGAAIRAMHPSHADRLLFFPRMPQRALFPIITAAKLVVLPSLWENLANTCLEAMQLGKAVIATRHCGFEEVIVDGTSGFLVEPGSVQELATCLSQTLKDEALIQRVGLAAQRRVADFHIDVMAQRLATYYEQLVHGKETSEPTGRDASTALQHSVREETR